MKQKNTHENETTKRTRFRERDMQEDVQNCEHFECVVSRHILLYMDRIKLYLCFVHFCFSAHRFMWLLQIRNYTIAIIIININYMGKNVKMICDPQCLRTHTNTTYNKYSSWYVFCSHIRIQSVCWMWFLCRKVVDRQPHILLVHCTHL